jgi:hypothetical protein
MYMYLIRMASETELFHCTVSKLLIRKRYCLLFKVPVLVVQMTKFIQLTKYNTRTFSETNSAININALCISCEDMICCLPVQCTVHVVLLKSEIALSLKPFGIGQMCISNFLLRLADITTFQKLDLFSWDTLCREVGEVTPSSGASHVRLSVALFCHLQKL